MSTNKSQTSPLNLSHYILKLIMIIKNFFANFLPIINSGYAVQ